MATKTLSVSERKSLIEHHAQCVLSNFRSIQSPDREQVMESIQRLTELAKSLPKHEWAIPL